MVIDGGTELDGDWTTGHTTLGTVRGTEYLRTSKSGTRHRGLAARHYGCNYMRILLRTQDVSMCRSADRNAGMKT